MPTILLFLLSTFALAFDPASFLELQKKHCDQGVESACESMKCMIDIEKCMNKSSKKDQDKHMGPLIKKCKGDQKCIDEETKKMGEEALKELAPKCAAGDKNACYQKEMLESMSGKKTTQE